MAKQLRLSSNKMLTGTAAGLAEYFDMDPNVMRIIIALLTIFTGGVGGIIAYLVVYFIMSSNK